MGEQSVGKSFTLNHLVDTSFAGSAMRTTGMFSERPLCKIRRLTACTEGVWMSVSPTDDALIVALDFEGELSDPLVVVDLWVSYEYSTTTQVYTVSSARPRKTRCSFSLTLLFPIW